MHSLSGMETGSVELFLQSRRGIPEGPWDQNRTTDMDNFFKYYFLGIGGIGMSALARYFNAQGFRVAGYDRAESLVTDGLEAEGIQVVTDERVAALPAAFIDPKATLVVYTPAIPADHPQLLFFRQRGFAVRKRAEVLGDITRRLKALCVAGTHGKTTTSTIAAHLLHQSQVGCNAFLGGISANYHSNLLLSRDSSLVVVEADEYDRSFLQLSPFMAVITSVDADHLDIYGTPAAYREGFERFASLIAPGGSLIVHTGIDLDLKLAKGVRLYTYSLHDGGDFHAENVRQAEGRIYFDFVAPTERVNDLYLNVPLMINVENSVAALALAWLNGVSKEELRTGISSYAGIYRRFNTVYRSDRVVYMDDYAHHPAELATSIRSIRGLYPGRRLTGVFQPHLYSRTRDFAPQFAEALSALDELILLPIYPARERPIPGVTSELILKDVKLPDKTLCSKENLLPLLSQKPLDVLVTFGAGDIDRLVPRIAEMLRTPNPLKGAAGKGEAGTI